MEEIIRLALFYKSALDNLNTAAVHDLANRYVGINNGLNAQVNQLLNEIAALGKTPTENWIRELQYYQSLQEQAINQLSGFSGDAYQYYYQQSSEAIKFGFAQARDLVMASYPLETMAYFKGLPTPQIEALYSLVNTDTVKRLFNSITPDAVSRIESTLFNGLAMGKPYKVIGDELAKIIQMPLSRAITITRTELNRAHRLSSLSFYQQYGVKRYKRMASKGHACMACLLLDGQIYSSEQMLEDHPNGACFMVPIVEGAPEPEWEYGKDYFLRLSPEEQAQRMGAKYYEAWQSGQFKLEELTTIKENHIWGNTPQVKPLSEFAP